MPRSDQSPQFDPQSTRSSDRTFGALLHLSTLTKYAIPFGNFLFPIILWITRKQDSAFVDYHGRQSLNFQISLFLYSLFIALAGLFTLLFLLFNPDSDSVWHLAESNWQQELSINLPVIFTFACTLTLLLSVKILDLICVITASIRAAEGRTYHFPLSIPFLRKKALQEGMQA